VATGNAQRKVAGGGQLALDIDVVIRTFFKLSVFRFTYMLSTDCAFVISVPVKKTGSSIEAFK